MNDDTVRSFVRNESSGHDHTTKQSVGILLEVRRGFTSSPFVPSVKFKVPMIGRWIGELVSDLSNECCISEANKYVLILKFIIVNSHIRTQGSHLRIGYMSQMRGFPLV